MPFRVSDIQNLAIITLLNEYFLILATLILPTSTIAVFLIKLMGVKWFFPNISVCRALVRNELQHLFVYLFPDSDVCSMNSRTEMFVIEKQSSSFVGWGSFSELPHIAISHPERCRVDYPLLRLQLLIWNKPSSFSWGQLYPTLSAETLRRVSIAFLQMFN